MQPSLTSWWEPHCAYAPPPPSAAAGKVLDLGCHPGAWLQVACKALGPPKNGGMVFGVDIQVPLPVLPGALARWRCL